MKKNGFLLGAAIGCFAAAIFPGAPAFILGGFLIVALVATS